jgi:hypothetical protein
LSDTLWRPLSLASAIVPYGRAGDADISRLIVQILKQQQLLTWGEWSAAPLPTGGSSTHIDLWGLVTRSPDPSVASAQASFLQASGLPSGCLRLLFPVLRETPNRESMNLFVQCQVDLAYDERLQIGEASRWRAMCAGELAEPGPWQAALIEYRRGQPAAAAQFVKDQDAEALYARGWLLLEAADPRGRQVFEALIAKDPTHRLVALAKHVLQSL